MKCSVAITTYHGEPWLDEQLRSIAHQSRPPDEIVIRDDGSTDGTPQIVERFTPHAPCPVYWAVNPERLGPAQNFAHTIAQCTGDLIALADQDDRWHTDKLQITLDAFNRDPAIDLVFSDLDLIDASSKPTGATQWQALGFSESMKRLVRQGDVLDVLLKFNVVTGAAMVFRASLRDRVLPIPDYWMHDEWIALITAATGKVTLIDDTLQDYRLHDNQHVGPGVQGLHAQLVYAKAHMDTDYFRNALHRANAARERLRTLDDQNIPSRTLDSFDLWVAHQQTRLQMRETQAMRSRQVVGELFRGGYRKFGYGWKSALQDLLLR